MLENSFQPRTLEQIAADCRDRVNNDKGMAGDLFIRAGEEFLIDGIIPVCGVKSENQPRKYSQIIEDMHLRIHGQHKITSLRDSLREDSFCKRREKITGMTPEEKVTLL